MICPICGQPCVEGERLQCNVTQTFIWKPASVPDEPITMVTKTGATIYGSAAAILPADEMALRRAAYTKTAVATVYFEFGKVPMPEGAMNVRHALCVAPRTAQTPVGAHPRNKHAIRFQRPANPKAELIENARKQDN